MKDAPVAAKIPVLDGETVKFHALVDQVDFKRLSQHEWYWDEKNELTYRNVHKDGKTVRSALHREVMGLKKGDGKVLIFKSEDRLDCRRSNLEFGPSRDLAAHHPDKWFPRKRENFVSYIKKNHPKSPIANLLEVAELDTYNMREVRFTVEEDLDSKDDSKKSSGFSLQSELASFMQNEFGYKGKVAVVRVKAKKADLPKTPEKPAPEVKPVLDNFVQATKPAPQSEPKPTPLPVPEPVPAPLPPAAAALVSLPTAQAAPMPPQPRR